MSVIQYFPSGMGGSYLHSKFIYKIIERHEQGNQEAVSHVFRVAVQYSYASVSFCRCVLYILEGFYYSNSLL